MENHLTRLNCPMIIYCVEYKSPSVSDSPACRVVLFWVKETGGVQLTAHQSRGALITSSVRFALGPRVTIQPASCSKHTFCINIHLYLFCCLTDRETHRGHVCLSYEASLSLCLCLCLSAAMGPPHALCHCPGHLDFQQHSQRWTEDNIWEN